MSKKKTESLERVETVENVHRMGDKSELDKVQVGDWFWVTEDVEEWDDEKEEEVVVGQEENLYCVSHIGSNYIKFEWQTEHGSTSFRLHFDEFYARCRKEENWKEHFQSRMDNIQIEMQKKMQELLEEGRSLSLLPQEASQPETQEEKDSLLPVRATASPEKYKTDLVAFRDARMPVIQKEIEELGEEYAVMAKNMAGADLVKLRHVKKALGVVEDRIFTVELYCGLKEQVHQIKQGLPAPAAEPIHLMQQMLYMDEETLFDYKEGGMDFQNLDDFDEWVVAPENLERMCPHKKCIVAFRVRRYRKDYGEAPDIVTAWAHARWNEENFKTYLLIRNGNRVYRIATEIDFSPRLIPFKNEIGEAQFKKVHRHHKYVDEGRGEFPFGKRMEWEEEEDITPDHVEYDDHVKKMENLLKHYNRMIILIQGLLDRSRVFHPHPGIKLTRDDYMDKWLICVRDEELALPNNELTWEGYRDGLNAKLKRGDWIYSAVGDKKQRSYNANARPNVIQVGSIRRDRSEVKVSWSWGKRWGYEHKEPYGSGYYGKWGQWDVDKMLHQWIPMDKVVNLNAYQLGDYKKFLCDRALQGKYLKWAHYLLTAEDWKRKQIKEGKDIVEATKEQGRAKRTRVVKKTVEVEEEY